MKSRGRNVVFDRSEDFDEPSESRAIDEMLQFGVRALREQGVPVVLVDRYLSDLDTAYVVADNFSGAYYAAQHLILLGYDRFEFALSRLDGARQEQLLTTSVRDRYHGYCQAPRDYGLESALREPRVVALSDRDAVRAALGRPRESSAGGASTPLAIVGYDDLPIASHLSVPLTTILQPRYDIGFRAGHLLIDTIEGHAMRGDKLSLPVSLIVRESCGACRLARRRIAEPSSPFHG